MKQNNPVLIATVLLFVTALSSCEVVGGIFKAGIWVGVVIVVAIILLILWLVRKAK